MTGPLQASFFIRARDSRSHFTQQVHCSLTMNGERPPPADANLVAQLARVGPIGLCLSDALDDLVSECLVEQIQGEAGEKSDSEKKTESVKIPFDSTMGDRVMHSFGQAVSKSQWEAPPAALLRGRVEHYNSLEGKWRIVVNNAEIRERVQLPQTNPRKKKRTALWDASELRQGEQQPATALTGSLQILAYDDL